MKIRKYNYDVAVIGGGSSGVSAAVGSAKLGAKTVLIERNPYFGGQATHCSIPSYCGFFTQSPKPEQVAGGLAHTLLKKLSELNAYDEPVISPKGNVVVPIDPEAVKFVLDQCITESKITPLLDTQVVDCFVEKNMIKYIECIDDEGRFFIEAKSYVDASGEANLANMANSHFITYDDESLQVGTLMIRIGGVDKNIHIDSEIIEKSVISAKKNFFGHFSKNTGYVSRMPVSNDIIIVIASEYIENLDAENITKAEIATRKQSWSYLEAFKRYIPGFENAYLVSTGPKIGIRESRHVLGEYILSKEDVLNANRFKDTIGRGSWPIEIHANITEPSKYYYIKDNSYYDIPIRILKSDNIINLWTCGRIVSCDKEAFGSIRVLGTGFITGHAAGVACAHTLNNYNYDFRSIQKELIKQNAIL